MSIIAHMTFKDNKQGVIFNEETRNFKDIREAVRGVKEEFGIKGKTQPMFINTKSGKTIRIGFVKNYWERYDDTGARFPAELWTSFDECKPVNLDESSMKKKLKGII